MQRNRTNKDHGPSRRRTKAARSLTHRLSLVQPIRFADLHALVQPHLRAGLTAKCLGEDGHWGTWSASTVQSAWSDVHSGLVHAALSTLTPDEASVGRARYALEHGPQGADIRALLHRVPEAVASLRSTPDSRRTARTRASRLLTALVSGFSDKAPVRLRTSRLSEEWQQVVAAVRAHRPAVTEGVVTGLMHLAVACTAAGFQPDELPNEPLALGKRLATLVPKRQTRFAVRSALGQLAALQVPGIPHWPVPARLVASRRLAGTVAGHLDIARPVVPALVALVERWQALRRTGGIACSDTTLDHMEAALLRIVAFAFHAAQAGVVPHDLARTTRLWRWWTEPLPIYLNEHELQQRDAVHDDSLLGETEATPDGLPALLAVLVWAARTGLLLKASPGLSSGLVPSVRADADAAWRAAQHVAAVHTKGRVLAPKAAAERAQAEAAWRTARESLMSVLGTETPVKNKREAATMFSLPWALAFALPWWTECELSRLRAVCDGMRSRLDAQKGERIERGRQGGESHPELDRAEEAYREGLRQWLAFAAFVGDPVRCRNHWAARVGVRETEVTIEATYAADGSLEKITRVDSHYGGAAVAVTLGNELAMLKTRNFGQRHWQWPRVAVDYRWLAEYLTHVWLPTLKRRSLIAADATMREALHAGTFALFVTDGGKWRRPRRGKVTPGAYADAHGLRVRFRAALLAAMRGMRLDEYGIIADPIPLNDGEAARRWPWLLTPHVTRLWWATHCLGVLALDGVTFERCDSMGRVTRFEPDALAARATTDRVSTLKKDYSVPIDTAKHSALSEATDWRHPLLHQRPVIDFLVMPGRRPNFAALWDAWSRAARAGEIERMPRALAMAWMRRRQGADVRIIAVRRRKPH